MRQKLLILISALLFALTPGLASASYQSQIDTLNAKIAKNQQTLDRISSRADTLQNQVDSITAEVNTLQNKIDLANLQIQKTTEQISITIKKLDKAKEIMFENARVLYKLGDPSTIEVLASSDNFSEFINRQEYLERVKEAVNQAAERFIALKDELEQKQAQLKDFVKEQESQKDLVQLKLNEQAQLLAQTRGDESKYQSLVSGLKKQLQKAEAALVASLSNGNYKAAPVGPVSGNDIVGSVGSSGLSSGAHLHLEVRVDGSTRNPASYIEYEPVQPPVITQSYGNPDPIYVSGKHPGVDYAPGDGAIHAIDAGYMYRGCSDQLLGTDNNAYGYVAIIEHSGGHISIYAHMAGGPSSCNYNTYY